MSARTLLASAGTLAAVLVIPLLIEAQGPTRVDPQVMLRAVMVRNECPRTVNLSYGRHAPLRAQDMTTLGPRMQSVETFLPGDMVWLLGSGAEELDRAVIELDVIAITVGPSCVRLHPARARW